LVRKKEARLTKREFSLEDGYQYDRSAPIYAELPGWETDLRAIRRREELPPEARAYVARVEELTGVHVAFTGVGPEREEFAL